MGEDPFEQKGPGDQLDKEIFRFFKRLSCDRNVLNIPKNDENLRVVILRNNFS